MGLLYLYLNIIKWDAQQKKYDKVQGPFNAQPFKVYNLKSIKE